MKKAATGANLPFDEMSTEPEERLISEENVQAMSASQELQRPNLGLILYEKSKWCSLPTIYEESSPYRQTILLVAQKAAIVKITMWRWFRSPRHDTHDLPWHFMFTTSVVQWIHRHFCTLIIATPHNAFGTLQIFRLNHFGFTIFPFAAHRHYAGVNWAD